MRGGLILWLALAGALLSSAATPRPAASSVEYHLGAGDKLRITTFGEAALSGEFIVSGVGDLAFPLIGAVKAGGLTTLQVQDAIQTALRDGYLTDPKVSVEVLAYRPFYILGEVNRPGDYPYTVGLTVMNAVATANGFTYRANTKRVSIKHQTDAEPHDQILTSSTPVEPGDTIRIKERYF